jgi:Rieske Fe-S protein
MPDDPQKRYEQDLDLDPRIDSPAREGLAGTAGASLYGAGGDAEELTVAPDRRPMAEQPQWRKDFAIDWPQDQYVARRDFAKFLVLTSGAFVAGQAWIAAKSLGEGERAKPAPKRIGTLAELPPGSATTFTFPGDHDACILVRTREGELVAYSQECTHLSCAIVPRVAEGVLHCPCHEGYFDLETGRNISGPPPRPLTRIELEVDGDAIYAVAVQERTV